MATTTTINSNYTGTAAGQIIGQAYREADTIRLGLVTMLENVGYQTHVRKIALGSGRTAYACGFTPNGSVTLSERTLTPVKVKDDMQWCKEDFRVQWSEATMGASARNPNMPADVMEAIQLEWLKNTAQFADATIWQGNNTTNAEEWDGFETLWTADASVIKPTAPSGTPALDEDSVLTHLKVALEAVPVAVRRYPLIVAVAPDVFQYYWFYLTSRGILNDGNASEKQVRFGKYMITEVNGMSDNKIAVFNSDNLFFGTGLDEDFNTVALVDEDNDIGLLTGQVRGKMVYSGGVQYANSEDIVYYNAVAVP